MELTLHFAKFFCIAIYEIAPLPIFFLLMISLLGHFVGKIEKWTAFDAFYWAFITAFTVGYGDLRPIHRRSRLLSILVAFFGIMFTGIVVAITVTSATEAFAQYGNVGSVTSKMSSPWAN